MLFAELEGALSQLVLEALSEEEQGKTAKLDVDEFKVLNDADYLLAAMLEKYMAKSTTTYWNPLDPENRKRWTSISGLEGIAEELTLSIDPVTGEYTRLTRFLPGADTAPFGGKTHIYPEEVFIVSGRLYDQAFDQWLEAGHYASRPPGELHGPFKTDEGCVVLEVSFPNRVGNRS